MGAGWGNSGWSKEKSPVCLADFHMWTQDAQLFFLAFAAGFKILVDIEIEADLDGNNTEYGQE